MDYLKQRAKEPSTWAGLGAVIASGGTAYLTRDPNAILGALAGLLAIFMREKGPAK